METITNKTNSIKLTIDTVDLEGNPMKIDVRLSDDCKNGYNDFAITGTIWEKGRPRTDGNMITSGAIGDKIAESHPNLKIFNNLHLCDVKGAPMYAVGNGFYHLQNSDKSVVMDYLRVSEEEYNILSTAKEELYFHFLIEKLNIPQRWEKEAQEAIKILEELTGKKFKDDSKRFQFTPLADDVKKEIETKVDGGYYSEEAIEEREQQKKRG